MEYELYASLFANGQFSGLLALMKVGRRIGVHRLEQDPEGARAGVRVVKGAAFGLIIARTTSK